MSELSEPNQQPEENRNLPVQWADKAMFDAEPIKAEKVRGMVVPKVHLLSATPDPLGAVAAACRMYEGKPTYSLAEITNEERVHYWEQVQKTHLKAPLEFIDLHFFMEGVDRSFTHQHVRQRTAVFAQESMRFAVKGNMAEEVGLPPSIREGTEQAEVWQRTVDATQDAYTFLVGTGTPAEDARGLLPHATPTRLNYKTNMRNLLDHAGNRLCTQAQFVWRYVFTGIVQAIREHGDQYLYTTEPGDGGDEHPHTEQGGSSWQWHHIADSNVFKPVCFQLGHCPFTADFDRGCTIRDRVQAGEFDKIDDAEWAMDPTAAWVR